MKTPICDFVRRYIDSGALRLHMPGHKGTGPLGFEAPDITEIDGADSLYSAQGIIRESEQNASRLFGCPTFYSAEGSSHCIRAMLYLILSSADRAGGHNGRPLILAARNAHRAFISAAALLDFDIMWLRGDDGHSYLESAVCAETLEYALKSAPRPPAAVYITSPDYLGNTADIAALSAVCRRYGVPLAVDNAHGAYLHFLPKSRHPMDLGADICCDSAHKTLPVLTGGAYLHISPHLAELCSRAKDALLLFGSTSPSYLILQSLDAANPYLEGYPDRLAEFLPAVRELKTQLARQGFELAGDEELKLTVRPKSYGYTGIELADFLAGRGIVCEFADPDFTVMMLAPETGEAGLLRLREALASLPRRARVLESAPKIPEAEQVMTVRSAVFAASESLPAVECEGRILASESVGCPPAVPIAVCGERIGAEALRCFEYYGITKLRVVRK